MPSEPVAFLLTWTCYGTWLHGDPRASVDARHNSPGGPFVPPNPFRAAVARDSLRHEPVMLRPVDREIVRHTIERHCHIREWMLHAVNVRTNHVHVVVSCEIHPDEARDQLKAWCTRRLREAGQFSRGREIWTEGGSDRWMWNQRSLADAVEYVLDGQGGDLG